MCGLSAIFSLKPSPLIDGQIELMHDAILSRGPDGDGFHREENLALSHRRLAIIDTSSSANQPFYLNDRYVLVFNGEIYNYREIRSRLIGLGFKFSTNSDTEVLLAAYSHWGESCQHMFNGMWAFVIWDRRLKRLFCSRDRFGVKPLYWAVRDDFLYLASEPKQLVALGFGKHADNQELSRFLFTGVAGMAFDAT